MLSIYSILLYHHCTCRHFIFVYFKFQFSKRLLYSDYNNNNVSLKKKSLLCFWVFFCIDNKESSCVSHSLPDLGVYQGI